MFLFRKRDSKLHPQARRARTEATAASNASGTASRELADEELTSPVDEVSAWCVMCRQTATMSEKK